MLRSELLLHSYKPKPLVNFVIRDPKTRKISKSDFRDRVIHHALCNLIEPIFDKYFIYDSYANRKNKGTLKAIDRFDYFKRKVSKNNTIKCYILKADIKKYFDNVDHEILIKILKRNIKDEKLIWLTKQIMKNFKTKTNGKGIPLGNYTSQFFANVYLNDLDYFVKHKLKVKYYIRYVDDFVILHKNKKSLEKYKNKIDLFLKNLKLELHPDKSNINPLRNGIIFLGYRIFGKYKLLRKTNLRKFKRNFNKIISSISKINDLEIIHNSLHGWFGYAMWANTYKFRKKIMKTMRKKTAPIIINITLLY
jgi:retron-type reverse transcriptase